MNEGVTQSVSSQSPGTGVPGLWLFPLTWGFAEATLFFIVPDVFLTWVALQGIRRGFKACGWALGGALLGGATMWLWGRGDAGSATEALDHVPAISPLMIASVRDMLASVGLTEVFFGPLFGTPYKVYAVQAGSLGMPLIGFLIVSVPARLIRFIVLTLLSGAISGWIGDRLSISSKRAILTILWVSFYGWYFSIMPN